MSNVFVGDVGTEIVLDCGVDISSATLRKIIVRKPMSSTRTEWNAIAEGSTSIKYVTTEGDIDSAGIMTLQAYVEMPNWKGYGNKVNVNVLSPI